MKTLDELDALYAEMAEAERALATAKHAARAAVGHNPQAWHREVRAKERHDAASEAFIAAMHAAWPEVRERLRRAEREREAARAYLATCPHDVVRDEQGFADYDHRKMVESAMHSLRAALTEEPPR